MPAKRVQGEVNMSNLIRRNPFDVFDNSLFPTSYLSSMFEDVFKGFDETFDNELMRPAIWATKVKSAYPMNVVNVRDENGVVTETRLEYALAGFKPEEIRVTRSGNTVKVVAEHKSTCGENETMEYSGISYRKFEREYHVPFKADKDGISKKFENGLLSITIPIKIEKKDKGDEEIEI